MVRGAAVAAAAATSGGLDAAAAALLLCSGTARVLCTTNAHMSDYTRAYMTWAVGRADQRDGNVAHCKWRDLQGPLGTFKGHSSREHTAAASGTDRCDLCFKICTNKSTFQWRAQVGSRRAGVSRARQGPRKRNQQFALGNRPLSVQSGGATAPQESRTPRQVRACEQLFRHHVRRYEVRAGGREWVHTRVQYFSRERLHVCRVAHDARARASTLARANALTALADNNVRECARHGARAAMQRRRSVKGAHSRCMWLRQTSNKPTCIMSTPAAHNCKSNVHSCAARGGVRRSTLRTVCCQTLRSFSEDSGFSRKSTAPTFIPAIFCSCVVFSPMITMGKVPTFRMNTDDATVTTTDACAHEPL